MIERGDPWGQLIAIQHALATLPRFGVGAKRDELAREEARLMFVAAQRLWGPLGETIVDDAAQRYASDVLDCEWKCGFIRSARGRATENQLELVLRDFAGLEITAFLNSLYLESWGWSLTVGDALAAHPWPALRELADTTRPTRIRWSDSTRARSCRCSLPSSPRS